MMGSKKTVEEMSAREDSRILLAVARSVVDLAINSIDNLKEAALQQTGREGEIPEEWIDFWNLVDIRCDNLIESMTLLLSQLRGKEEDDDLAPPEDRSTTYRVKDTLLCLKDFTMKSGAVAFKEDSVYEVKDIIRGKGYIDIVMNSEIDERHTMPEVDVDKHFIRYVDWTKKKGEDHD